MTILLHSYELNLQIFRPKQNCREMKFIFRILLLSVFLSIIYCQSSFSQSLPTVEVFGDKYYFYDLKKNESVYGVAKRYDWDLDILYKLNPTIVSGTEKVSRIYYPVDTAILDPKLSEPQSFEIEEEIQYEPIIHTIKKGETVYGIAKQYNVPIETIYAAYPQAKHGIKAGDQLVLPQSAETVVSRYYYYQIKPGDSLREIAKTYNTSVEDILASNPGVKEDYPAAGEKIRIKVNSKNESLKLELVEENRLSHLENYKVDKSDTWATISSKTGIDTAELKEANPSIATPQKDDILVIPVMETINVEKEVKVEEPELTETDVQEIYEAVHGGEMTGDLLEEVNVALLLDDPSSNKDIDFTRGFLIALNGMKHERYKINLKVIDGRQATNNLVNELEYFEPHLIIATADKAFPFFLADFGNENNVEVINVFDVKNDLYEDNSSMVQILPPASYFNQKISDRLSADYSNRQLVYVEGEEEQDGIGSTLIQEFAGFDILKFSLSEFMEFIPSPENSYIVYSSQNKKEEVADVIQWIENLESGEQPFDVVVAGRSNWITFRDLIDGKINSTEILIPSRTWLDENSVTWKDFSSSYQEMFDGTPIKSYPNFAANGHDIASFFIPVVANNGGDFNKGVNGNNRNLLQSEINLDRINNWSGFLNSSGFLLKLQPNGIVRKIVIR